MITYASYIEFLDNNRVTGPLFWMLPNRTDANRRGSKFQLTQKSWLTLRAGLFRT